MGDVNSPETMDEPQEDDNQWMYASETQLSFSIVTLGISVLLMVNVFWHLCARNWSLPALLFHVVTVLMEIVVSVYCVIVFVNHPDGGKTAFIQTLLYLIYATLALSFMRWVYPLFRVFFQEEVIGCQ